ncbi:phosphoribosylglycinamide formyltransferase [Clostridium sp. UBA4548]|uniref:phosphoribosylglycinamide formyltransferase n=1 Tax=Clostridium sp. UBA4548 TaxID=1946361 RepID=UPI0025BE7C63|nr:phosphoribosylglycinamide formyltransferase [Clostridium sp. UBA4548]
MNIAVFASHGGSDLQAIIDGCKSGKINSQVKLVISNNSNSMALQRAKNEGILGYHISQKVISDNGELDKKILSILVANEIDMIFLAGYLKMLGTSVLQKYSNRIFNIHPALLPKYGGKGMYGMNVHKAVIEAREKISGVTIHRVNEKYDSGEIVAQAEVPVMPNDTPEELAARVLEREHSFLIEVIHAVINGNIKLGE